MTPVNIKPGQLWQEADKRFTRIVEVLEVSANYVSIITRSIDPPGTSTRWRPTRTMRSRFKPGRRSSHCGYFLVKEAPHD